MPKLALPDKPAELNLCLQWWGIPGGEMKEKLDFLEANGFGAVEIPSGDWPIKNADAMIEAMRGRKLFLATACGPSDFSYAEPETVSDGDPAVITKISLEVIPPPAGAPVPERLTQRAAVAAWNAEIDKTASTGKFSGVWLWAKNGKAITSGARGKADRETGIDNTLNTRFRIGSMNKMFTAVSTLQLVERGKLSLDDTIGKILPDYGFGFQIGRPDEARTYGHGGGAPGMNTILRVYPESGQSVIVLCNLDSPSASRKGDWLHARMPLK